ncbi:hypothetical protein GN109_12370 [Collimonas pratensis]|nr:hypothetical protein [Collimonas pratensis]NKI70218.1 hypothetical protein [Collimonas pratensis]
MSKDAAPTAKEVKPQVAVATPPKQTQKKTMSKNAMSKDGMTKNEMKK